MTTEYEIIEIPPVKDETLEEVIELEQGEIIKVPATKDEILENMPEAEKIDLLKKIYKKQRAVREDIDRKAKEALDRIVNES